MAKNEKNTASTENTDLQLALDTATANLEAAIEAGKAAAEALKDGKKNHGLAKNYLKNAPEGQEEVAAESERGWAEAVTQREAGVVDAKDDVKAAREALKVAKAAMKSGGKTAASEMPEQNGQRHPRPESKSGTLWAIFDAATEARGSTCAIADVMDQCAETGMTEGSIRSSYSHWRKFHGIAKGRINSTEAANMSAEKRAEQIAKVTEQLEKANARVAKLNDALAELNRGADV